MPDPKPREAHARLTLGCLATGMGLLCLGAKLDLIRRFGSALPNIDQWYAEARALLIPLQEGHLKLKYFFVPHNEHRIVFTRLLNLGLALANRQWDPILEMVVNAGIDAVLAGALAALAWSVARGLAAALAIAAIGLLFMAPTAWENSLGGFQSQFYLMEGAALAHLWLVIGAEPLSRRWWAGFAVGVLAFGTMASGFFAAVASLLVTLLRMAEEPARRNRANGLAAALLLVLCLVGIKLLHRVPGADAYRAASVTEWAVFVAHALDWPFAGWVLQLPLVALIGRGLYARRFEPADLLLLALGLWSWIQIAAQAFSRGHVGLLSRYTDLYAFGLVANLLVLPSVLRSRPRLQLAALAAWMILFGWGMRLRSEGAGIQLDHYAGNQAVQIDHVRAYVLSGDRPALLAVPATELPYPSAERLAEVLDHPGIRPLLPPELRAPLQLNAAPATVGFMVYGRRVDPIWRSAGPASFTSEPVPAGDNLPVLHFHFAGGPAAFRPAGGKETRVRASPVWATVDLKRPRPGPAPLQVASGQSGVVFSDPVEMGWGSWAARHACADASFVLATGGAALAAAAGLGLRWWRLSGRRAA